MISLMAHSLRIIGAGLFLLLVGCGSTAGSGGAAISTNINMAPRYNVEKAVVTVFFAEGFQIVGSGNGQFGFAREGDATTQKNFGDWFGPGVTVRADVIVKELEFGKHQVNCAPFLQQGTSFTPTSQGAARFKTLMKRVKKLAGVL